MKIEGLVGQVKVPDGGVVSPRVGRLSEIITTELHGKFYESAARGNLFYATHPLAGVAAGASATADTLSTTATWALANPVGSGVNLSVVALYIDYIRVPTLAGTHWITWSINTVTPLATGTLSTPQSALLGGAGSSAAKPYFGATLPVVPAQTALIPLVNQGTGAVTVADSLNAGPFYPDGTLVVAPGALAAGQGVPQAAAALANVLAWTVVWEEIPQ